MSQRVLCLKFASEPHLSAAAIEEAFSGLSDRLLYRIPGLLFLEASRSAIPTESKLMQDSLLLAQELRLPPVRAAISDTAYGAQVLAVAHPTSICPPGEERGLLQRLSLPLLLHLEGTKMWSEPKKVDQMISFFLMLGHQRWSDIVSVPAETFSQRWGALGLAIWQRLRGLELQPLPQQASGLRAREFVHLHCALRLPSLLLHEIDRGLRRLQQRLDKKGCQMQELVVSLQAEEGNLAHTWRFSALPGAATTPWLDWLEARVESLDLSNPIRALELSTRARPVPRATKLERLEAEPLRAPLDEIMAALKQKAVRQVLTPSDITPATVQAFSAFALRACYREAAGESQQMVL